MLHIAALLSHKKTERLGLLPVPASLPPVVFLPETPSRYILTEDILLAYADHVFEMYDVLERPCSALPAMRIFRWTMRPSA